MSHMQHNWPTPTQDILCHNYKDTISTTNSYQRNRRKDTDTSTIWALQEVAQNAFAHIASPLFHEHHHRKNVLIIISSTTSYVVSQHAKESVELSKNGFTITRTTTPTSLTYHWRNNKIGLDCNSVFGMEALIIFWATFVSIQQPHKTIILNYKNGWIMTLVHWQPSTHITLTHNNCRKIFNQKKHPTQVIY